MLKKGCEPDSLIIVQQENAYNRGRTTQIVERWSGLAVGIGRAWDNAQHRDSYVLSFGYLCFF